MAEPMNSDEQSKVERCPECGSLSGLNRMCEWCCKGRSTPENPPQVDELTAARERVGELERELRQERGLRDAYFADRQAAAARIEELERALEEIDNRSQAPRLKDDAQVAAIRQCARDALVSREADAKGRNRE